MKNRRPGEAGRDRKRIKERRGRDVNETGERIEGRKVEGGWMREGE